MRFGFLNNFATQIAAPVAEPDTTIELSEGAELLEAALSSADAVALTLFATDSQGNETKREVVYATAVAAGVVTVERGQESANPQTFNPGDGVEARLTAGSLAGLGANIPEGDAQASNSLAIGRDSIARAPQGIALGYRAWANITDAIAIGTVATASAPGSIAIGGNIAEWPDNNRGQEQYDAGAFASGNKALAVMPGARATGDSTIALGYAAYASQYGGLSIGEGAQSTGSSALAFGAYAEASGYYAMAIGPYAEATGSESVAVGGYANAPEAVVFGQYAYATETAERSTVIGTNAISNAPSSTAQGYAATAAVGATGATSLGTGAYVSVPSGCRIHGVPYLPKWERPTDFSAQQDYDKAKAAADQAYLPIARQCAPQAAFSTAVIDVTSGGSSSGFELPPNTILLPDAFDVVVVESDGAGGAPEIQIGPDDVTPAAYLAATPVTKTSVGGRETHSPLVTDGITALRVSIVTPGSGTAYKIKVVVRGYVMEI